MVNPQDFAGVAGVAIIIALLQMAKPYLPDSRTWPVVAIIIGVAWHCLVAWASGTGGYPVAILTGFVVAVSASGLYSWGQTGKPDPPKG